MYRHFLQIHVDQKLASIAFHIHRLGIIIDGVWQINNPDKLKKAEKLIKRYKEREEELKRPSLWWN